MHSQSWTVPAHPQIVAFVRESVGDFACENGIEEPRLSDVRLAVSEAVTNAVVHAYRALTEQGTVVVDVTVCPREWIEIRVTDDGAGMTPRDDSPGLGLGLPLIRRLADQFDHRRPPDGHGTELWMRFAFSDASLR